MEKGFESERLSNYHTEMRAIRGKLENPDVPDGKKEKLRYRLRFLEEVLVPREEEALVLREHAVS